MDVARFLAAQPALLAALRAVAALGLPDAWIGAGCIRNAVWDALSGLPPGSNPPGDIDVVWFDAARADAALDRALEARLGPPFSVANQARMHARNGDAPYAGTLHAVAHWPETATAVLARWDGAAVRVAAPHGLDDLLTLTVRPTPHFAASAARMAVLHRRVAEKAWQQRWPGLMMAP